MTATLDPAEFFGEAAIQDPYPLYARLRGEGGVHRLGDSPFYLASSRAAITDVVNRPAVFSSNLTATMTFTPEAGMGAFPMEGVGGRTHILVTADDPVHAVHRKLMLGHFTAKRVQALQPEITRVFEDLWTRAEGGTLEWMDAVANRLPMIVVARLIGVPEADADQLAHWGYASTQLLDGLMSAGDLAASMAAIGELDAYLTTRLRLAGNTIRGADSGQDLMGVLAAACAAGDLDDFTARLILVSLFSAGGESTASLMGTAVAILATDPPLQRLVRERRDLLGAFIEETLRLEPPFRAHYRHVLADAEVAGEAVPRDSRVLLLWGSANRDSAHVEDPDDFRLDRPVSKAHMSFGRGIHFCLGAPLARLETATVLTMLMDRTEWFDAAEVGPWLPSVLARRREFLRLTLG